MDAREELAALRRMAELEAKAGGGAAPSQAQAAQPQTSEALGFLEGIQRPIANIDRAIGGGLKRIGIDTGSDERYARYEQEYGQGAGPQLRGTALEGKRPGMVGQVAGNVAATLPSATFLGPIAGGAAYGALTTDADSLQGAGIDAALGAAGGKAGQLLVKGASKLVRPMADAATRSLLDRGIPLTHGMMLGTAAKRGEDALTSIPVVGSMVSKAQARAVEKANRVAFDDVLKPVGEKLPDHISIGREGVDFVAEKLGKKYDDILGGLSAKADDQFVNDMSAVIDSAKANLPEQQFNRFKSIVETQISKKADAANAFDGKTLKGVNSEISRLSKGYRGDGSFDNRELGKALDEVQDAFRAMVSRSNPEQARALKGVDAAYARFARIRQASGYAGAEDGVFTGAQLDAAVKAGDKSVGKGQYARGKALMQDLSGPMKATLSQKLPNSGTGDRIMGAAAIGGSFVDPTLPLKLAAGGLLYTKPGQKVMRGLIAGAPEQRAALAEVIARGQLPGSMLGAASLPMLTK